MHSRSILCILGTITFYVCMYALLMCSNVFVFTSNIVTYPIVIVANLRTTLLCHAISLALCCSDVTVTFMVTIRSMLWGGVAWSKRRQTKTAKVKTATPKRRQRTKDSQMLHGRLLIIISSLQSTTALQFS